MTVCVAALCSGGNILGASDRMRTAGDVEFEPESSKIYAITNSIALMIAGDSSLHMALIYGLNHWTTQRIKEKPTEWIPVSELAQKYHALYLEEKSRRAEARVLGPLGLTLDTFIQRQNQMAPSFISDLTREILNFEMPPIEAIVTGLDMSGAHVYVVTNSEVTCRDDVGFAAIGVGYWHANSQFMFAGHHRAAPLPETLLLTYAAKRRAEVAPGVGVGTDMITIGPQVGSYREIDKGIVDELKKIYKRTRLRTTSALKISNREVNEYVQKLREYAAQQVQTSPEKPTDKPDGQEATDEGDEAAGARKPN